MQCSAQITILGSVYYYDRPCKHKAKYRVQFYAISRPDQIKSKVLCTLHKNRFVKELENDRFANLKNVEFI